MEQLLAVVSFLQSRGPEILSALLMVLGGLKVIARYTPWQADDHVLAVIEAPIKYLGSFFGKKEE